MYVHYINVKRNKIQNDFLCIVTSKRENLNVKRTLVSNLGFISKAEKHQRFKVYNILRLLHEAYNYSCIKNTFRYVDFNNHILVLLEKYNKQNVFFLERQNNNDE